MIVCDGAYLDFEKRPDECSEGDAFAVWSSAGHKREVAIELRRGTRSHSTAPSASVVVGAETHLDGAFAVWTRNSHLEIDDDLERAVNLGLPVGDCYGLISTWCHDGWQFFSNNDQLIHDLG